MQTREKAQRMHIVKKVHREIMEYNYTYSEEGAERNDGIHIVKRAQREIKEYIQ